jgi:RNA polymerase sigma factor (sigma-70 family)
VTALGPKSIDEIVQAYLAAPTEAEADALLSPLFEELHRATRVRFERWISSSGIASITPEDLWGSLLVRFLPELREWRASNKASHTNYLGYFTRAARWRFLDEVRRERRRAELYGVLEDLAETEAKMEPLWGEAPNLDPEAILLQRENALSLQEALTELPANQRVVLELFYRYSLNVNEISHLLGKSKQSINSLLQRARATLRAGQHDKPDH